MPPQTPTIFSDPKSGQTETISLVLCDQSGKFVKFEIPVSADTKDTLPPDIRQSLIDDLKEEIKKEILQELKGKRGKMNFEDAKALVIDYLTKIKKSGRKKVSLLELEVKLGVSEAQASQIMEKLKNSGVKEIG